MVKLIFFSVEYSTLRQLIESVLLNVSKKII